MAKNSADGAAPLPGQSPHAGAYDCIRLLASLLVLFSHSYALSGNKTGEPLWRLSGGLHDFGEVAVNLFFAMSGYLVTLSWLRDPHLGRFLLRRGLRVLPGLAAVVLGSVFVIGPAFTSLHLGAYFSNGQSWLYLTKITALPAFNGLPGVFSSVPFADVVNGSLWSLRLEVLCYLGLAVLGIAARRHGLALSGVVLLGLAGIDITLPRLLGLNELQALQVHLYVVNALIFVFGSVLARCGLPGNPLRLGLPALLAAVWLGQLPGAGLAFALALGVATIACAAALRCGLPRGHDYSYGLYLWAFPVQQATLALVPGLDALALFTRALPVTLLLAALSWHLIERRALLFKPRRQRGAA